MASAAPGSSLTFPGSWRKPGSSTIVPSRSRNTARWPSAIGFQCRNDGFDLVGENRARVEQHAIAGDTRDNRRVERAQVRDIGVRCLVSDAQEPRLQCGAGERAAADFRIALDQLALATEALQ